MECRELLVLQAEAQHVLPSQRQYGAATKPTSHVTQTDLYILASRQDPTPLDKVANSPDNLEEPIGWTSEEGTASLRWSNMGRI